MTPRRLYPVVYSDTDSPVSLRPVDLDQTITVTRVEDADDRITFPADDAQDGAEPSETPDGTPGAGTPVERCDGDHAEPPCADPGCWRNDPPDSSPTPGGSSELEPTAPAESEGQKVGKD